MSFSAAALWSAMAVSGVYLVAGLVASAGGAERLDLVTLVLCQSLAFVATLHFMLRLRDGDAPLAEAIGLRRTHPLLYVFAALLGVALHGPFSLIGAAIHAKFPLTEHDAEALRELLTVRTTLQKVGLGVAAGLVGPIVEEMFFRGGLYRGLRRAHGAGASVLFTSLLFAAAHLEPRDLLPNFLGGMAMGLARVWGGSLVPAILVHICFNSASVVVAIDRGPEADVLSGRAGAAASAGVLVLAVAYRGVAARSSLCSRARVLDQG